MNGLAGEVHVSTRLGAGRLRDLRVEVRRPALAPCFAGRTVAETLFVLPRLFAVCAQAQDAAAQAAVACALGQPVAVRHHPQVAAEALRELLMGVFGAADAQCPAVLSATLPVVLRAAGTPVALRSALRQQVLGFDPGELLAAQDEATLRVLAHRPAAPLVSALRERLEGFEPWACAAAALPAADAVASLAGIDILDAPSCATPTWHGAPAETGAVVRLGHHPLIAALRERPLLQRWCARLLEVAAYACEAAEWKGDCGLVAGAAVAEATGRGSAMTARGLLLHEVTIHQSRIVCYAILAPTEWNFHPGGPLAQWLEGTPAASPIEAVAHIRACAAALDPCVPCSVMVRDEP